VTDDVITYEQAVAARNLLNQTPMEIARKLAMTPATIRRAIGKNNGPPLMSPRLAKRLRSYFEASGVEFLPDGQVRIKQQ
jgi:predicted transcriptional regulator